MSYQEKSFILRDFGGQLRNYYLSLNPNLSLERYVSVSTFINPNDRFGLKRKKKSSPNPTFCKGVPTGLTLPVKTPLLQEGLGEAILARARSRSEELEQGSALRLLNHDLGLKPELVHVR